MCITVSYMTFSSRSPEKWKVNAFVCYDAYTFVPIGTNLIWNMSWVWSFYALNYSSYAVLFTLVKDIIYEGNHFKPISEDTESISDSVEVITVDSFCLQSYLWTYGKVTEVRHAGEPPFLPHSVRQSVNRTLYCTDDRSFLYLSWFEYIIGYFYSPCANRLWVGQRSRSPQGQMCIAGFGLLCPYLWSDFHQTSHYMCLYYDH